MSVASQTSKWRMVFGKVNAVLPTFWRIVMIIIFLLKTANLVEKHSVPKLSFNGGPVPPRTRDAGHFILCCIAVCARSYQRWWRNRHGVDRWTVRVGEYFSSLENRTWGPLFCASRAGLRFVYWKIHWILHARYTVVQCFRTSRESGSKLTDFVSSRTCNSDLIDFPVIFLRLMILTDYYIAISGLHCIAHSGNHCNDYQSTAG